MNKSGRVSPIVFVMCGLFVGFVLGYTVTFYVRLAELHYMEESVELFEDSLLVVNYKKIQQVKENQRREYQVKVLDSRVALDIKLDSILRVQNKR